MLFSLLGTGKLGSVVFMFKNNVLCFPCVIGFNESILTFQTASVQPFSKDRASSPCSTDLSCLLCSSLFAFQKSFEFLGARGWYFDSVPYFLLQQKIKLPKKTARRYPAYELYLYGEGNYAEENKNLVLTGIPVLFLPGNAGSYKQGKHLPNL